MSAAGKWFVTPHAARRFRERVAPDLTYDEALTELIRHSLTARRIKPWGDAVLYRSGKPERLRFLVREDGPGPLPTLITVYGGRGK